MARLLKERYKTYEGARKRAGFENGVASSEFKYGHKARLYHYVVRIIGCDDYRVERLDKRDDPKPDGPPKLDFVNNRGE